MNEPGGLDELSAAGRAACTCRVEERIAEVLINLGLDSPHRFVLAAPDERTRQGTAVDWPGLPLRRVECLTRHQALALLDRTPSGGEGRIRRLQEEHVEWRVVRDDVGIPRGGIDDRTERLPAPREGWDHRIFIEYSSARAFVSGKRTKP